jgi:hypothetical protein
MEAGSHTPTAALRVVEGDEKKLGAWGFNWAILSLMITNKDKVFQVGS